MAFEGAGQSDGVEIWRIEDFEAVSYPKEKHGKFHIGDSYIVLKTSNASTKYPSWSVHYWLGSETTQDEYGTAAFKAVELDDVLGGSPVQYREVQEHESGLFSSLFKEGVKYLPGGVKSGFTDVDAEPVEKRLFEVKGKRNIKIKQVAIEGGNINKCDCWIFDEGKGGKILVYMPPGASKMEQFKATNAANQIRDEDHAGSADVEIISEQLGDNVSRFFEALGISPDDVAETSNIADSDSDNAVNRAVKLFKISDASGSLQVSEVSGMPLTQDMLNPEDAKGEDDCFLLDTGKSGGIFVWIGKTSSKEEKVGAMKAAEGYLAKSDLPKWTNIMRVCEGCETTMFKQYFNTWQDPEDTTISSLGRTYPAGSIAEWDVSQLHAENHKLLARSGGAAIGFYPDNGTGSKEIYRIEDFELVPIEDENLYGKFFGGDSYVIRYTYQNSEGRDAYIVYFWQGNESTTDEKAASAINAVKLDDEVGGKAIQVRVVQGKEPRHFIKMFGGKMIVFSGGKASGFRNMEDYDSYDKDGTRLFRVRGTCAEDVMTTQIQPEKASSLYSEDVFILETPSNTWIWAGKESTSDEVNHAKTMAEVVSPGRTLETISEGSESDDFWTSLGGKGSPSKMDNALHRPILNPRLFHCKLSVGTGRFRAFEIFNFEKDDMVEDDVMILDSGDEIYVWIGNDANQDERKESLKLAENYINTDPSDRNSSNTLIFTINQGEEPKSFTCTFSSWQ